MSKLEDLERDVNVAYDSGYKPIARFIRSHLDNTKCCGIGASCMINKLEPTLENFKRKYNLDMTDVFGFTDGFDGNPQSEYYMNGVHTKERYEKLYNIGKRLAEKWNPTEVNFFDELANKRSKP